MLRMSRLGRGGLSGYVFSCCVERRRSLTREQIGLAAVPALPYLFDQPVEHATEWVFHKAFETIGGPEAVGHRTSAHKVEAVKEKEKEL
jgi:hypothetical protein